jgi:protein-S-isoprenylcysteine O-methyltransferase Ste14
MGKKVITMVAYFTLALLLLAFAYVVFRRIVRKDYQDGGRLGPFASIMQLLVFLGYFCFPYLFNPPEWPWFWRPDISATPTLQVIGLLLICLGFAVAFGTMFWFGITKAFGFRVDSVTKQGPYKISRNPQVLGGYLLVVGVFIQWPSLYAFGWFLMYAVITHWMVMTEEEHLLRIFGDEYEAYCAHVPRYLFL